MDSFADSHIYSGYNRKVESNADAEAYLMQREDVVRIESKYAERFFKDAITFQSKVKFMGRTKDGERIPVLYAIHPCI